MDDKIFDQKVAAEWIKTIEDPSANIRENDIYPTLRDWLSQSNPKNTLDIGCGQGICSAHLGNIQIQYLGLDPSPRLIHRAQELYASPSRTFIIGNAYELPFTAKHFSTAFSIAVWHLLGDLKKASSEMSRILEEDGKFLIVTADPSQKQEWTERYQEKNFEGEAFIGKNIQPDGSVSSDILYLRSLEEIQANLEAYGLTITRIETIRSFVAIFGVKKSI